MTKYKLLCGSPNMGWHRCAWALGEKLMAHGNNHLQIEIMLVVKQERGSWFWESPDNWEKTPSSSWREQCSPPGQEIIKGVRASAKYTGGEGGASVQESMSGSRTEAQSHRQGTQAWGKMGSRSMLDLPQAYQKLTRGSKTVGWWSLVYSLDSD